MEIHLVNSKNQSSAQPAGTSEDFAKIKNEEIGHEDDSRKSKEW
jgi:hypothetical protein